MKSKIIILILIGACALNLQAQKVLTLSQCVDSALQNNRKVKQQNLVRESNLLAYKQSQQDLLPNLNASAGQSFMFGRSLTVDNTYESVNSSQTSFNLSSGLVLFDGLRMKYNIQQKHAGLKASEADADKLRSDIEMNVTASYLQVLLYKELLINAKEQLTLTKQKLEQRRALVNSGKIAEGELFELISQEASEELSMVQSENNLKLALLDLSQIIELEDAENLDVVVPDYTLNEGIKLLSPDDVYKSALINRPEIKAAESRLESSKLDVSIARSALLPSLSLGASIGTGFYDLKGRVNTSFNQQINDNLSTNVGFNLQIPIFNKFETKNRIKSAEINVKNAQLQIDDTKLQLQKTIRQAYQNAMAAQQRWKSASKSESVSKEAYRYVEQKYENERATVYELYQAKNNLFRVQSELTQSKYEYVLRMKILELLQ